MVTDMLKGIAWYRFLVHELTCMLKGSIGAAMLLQSSDGTLAQWYAFP